MKPSSEQVALALDYSRNFANAKPNIGATEKEHILGLCNLLERATSKADAERPWVLHPRFRELFFRARPW